MDELMDMIVGDESPSNITNQIKNILFAKSADRIDNYRPQVSANVFAGAEESVETEEE